jgi:hypothetical protein
MGRNPKEEDQSKTGPIVRSTSQRLSLGANQSFGEQNFVIAYTSTSSCADAE